MSIQPLLDPETEEQPWSHLYCNKLSANYVEGYRTPTVINGILNSAYAVTSAPDIGAPCTNSRSFQQSSIGEDGKEYVHLSGHVTINPITAAFRGYMQPGVGIPATSSFSVQLTLPVKTIHGFDFVPGTISGAWTDTVSAGQPFAGNVTGVITSTIAGNVVFEVYLTGQGNAMTNRVVDVYYSFDYTAA